MTRRLPLGLAVLAALALPAASQEEEKKATLQEKALRHQKDVVEIGGMEFKRDVVVGEYTREELLAFIRREFEKDLPPEKAARFQRGYAKFGLVPKDLDFFEAMMDLLGSSISGFYYPKTKDLRLIRSGGEESPEAAQLKALGIDMEALTLVHELTHAAQDQNFELATLPLDDETNDDLVLALKAAIEGDASAVGWKYALNERFDMLITAINAGYKTGQLPGKAAGLPAYLRHTLTFPYGYGTDFVLKTLRIVNEEVKDAPRILKDLPISTEQVMHPVKYYGTRDNPTLVTLPDLGKLFGDGWKESFHNVHGEFVIGLLLKEFKTERLNASAAKKAAAGWDGDRYVILERKGAGADPETMYVWYSTWDSEDDAKEFCEAYVLALRKKHGQPEPEEGVVLEKTAFLAPDGQVLVERKGADVLALDGASDAMLSKVGEIWKGAGKAEMKTFERMKYFVCPRGHAREAFSGRCPSCGAELKFDDGKKEAKKEEIKKREF